VRAVAQLAGQVQPAGRRRLARDLGLRGAAGLARARREDDARDDRLGDATVVIQPVLERRRTAESTATASGCSGDPSSALELRLLR
jgi:hypothetical protein